MNKKDIFYRDKNETLLPSGHISQESMDSSLLRTDELFEAADGLSIRNAKRHRRILFALSMGGMLLTLFFLLYDEAELHGLILACGVMVLYLFFIRFLARRLDCHRKYLEYRVLAECLRCRFFLCLAGVRVPVTQILPWSLRQAIPWIPEVLSSLSGEMPAEKQPVLDQWIRSQKSYHEEALAKVSLKNRRDGRTAKIVLTVTILLYIAALFYELILYRNIATGEHADLIRAVLKILLGTMSAVTLFTGSYYGKMSLSQSIDDHKRMIALYEEVEAEKTTKGESEDLLLFLAREFLNENSTWYAYQSKNTPDISL